MTDALEKIKNFVEGSNDEELTFVALKPNATDTIGASIVMDKLTKNGYQVILHAPAIYTPKNVRVHYKEIYDGYVADPEGKFKFYPNLEEYLTRGPIYGFIIAGPNAVKGVKQLCGATKEPAEGTMRYDLAKAYGIEYDKDENGIHASGEVAEARREIANFMKASYSNISYTMAEAELMAEIADKVDEYSQISTNETTL